MLTAVIENPQAISDTLGNVRRVVQDSTAIYKIAADVVAAGVEARFAQGGPGWQDIKPQTRRQRRGDKGAPPLTDVGTLRKAVTATVPGVPYSLFGVAPDGLTMGTNAPGAAALNYGYGPRNLPAREFLSDALVEADRAALEMKIDGFFRAELGAL